MSDGQPVREGAAPVWVEDAFSEVDAVGQARWVREGKVSPLELVDAEAARERARIVQRGGLLAGVPTLLKDLLAYPGLPLEYGSCAFAGQRAQAGSDYTAALDEGGLVVLGKSATSELGLLGTTETHALGPTRNPWDPTRSTGGSSGGAVAAVASGVVPSRMRRTAVDRSAGRHRSAGCSASSRAGAATVRREWHR